MKYRFHPEAEEELNHQIDDYEKEKIGRIDEFFEEIIYAISSAVNQPKAWQKFTTRVRRRVVNKPFPYSVLYNYKQEKKEILIVAVVHHRRRPGYWKDRKF